MPSSTLKSIVSHQNLLEDLTEMVDVYGQVAALNLRRMRQEVVGSREYADALAGIFQEIKSAWSQREVGANVLPSNNKTVVVFVSGNRGFYGDIFARTLAKIQEIQGERKIDELVVLGSVGQGMLERRNLGTPITFFRFSDGLFSKEEAKQVLDHVVNFETILIVHGRYVSTVNQEIVATRLEGAPVEVIDYIFEPDADTIVDLFEGQILALVVEHALWEGQISKFASRIVHLGNSIGKIEDKLEQVKLQRQRIVQQQLNKKQRNRLISVRLLAR